MKKFFLVIAASMLPFLGHAQSDDFGTILSVEADKKINKKLTVSLDAEMRTRDDVKTVDRWSAGLQVSYKLLSWLKASAGYSFLYDNNERISYYEEGDGKVKRGVVNAGDPKKCAQYWGTRHRFQVSLTGSHKLGKLELSLRERWQYTYRPEYTVDERWSFFDDEYDGEEHTYRGKGKNVLRSRLQAEYKVKGFPGTPYAHVELFNAWNLEKVRYTLGYDWKINKQHTVGLFYRYQTVNNDDDNEANRHLIGLSYHLKF